MKKVFYKILGKYRFTSYPLQIYVLTRQYLIPSGWLESKHQNMPINEKKEPIPWLSYSMIDFLEKNIRKEHSVLEFGSGNSTIWFSKRVKRIVSIEYDQKFYDLIAPQLETFENNQYILAELNHNYHQQLNQYNNEFDIILVDGRERVDCIKNSLNAISKIGVIILDNSDRKEYKDAYDFLSQKGFRYIDFKSLSPAGIVNTQTTIFYRTENCFNI